MNGAPAISLQEVSKTFSHRPALFNWLGKERTGVTQALDGVSLEAGEGQVLVLLGPNGSGKTTLLKLISTMWVPDRGRVRVAGFDTVREPQRVRERVGFAVATERSFFPRLTARENLELFAALEEVERRQRRARISEALETAGLTESADTLAHKFSSGMYQRLGIARALLKNPSVLLMDEPSRSLDPGAALHMWRWVRQFAERGAAVVLASHNFEEAAAVGDQVAVLRSGRLLTHQQVQGSVESLRELYFRQVDPHAGALAGMARGAR